MRLTLVAATAADAPAIASLRNAVADDLTQRHGHGPWSGHCTDKGVIFDLRTSKVFVARRRSGVIATLRLATKKPWAIDRAYFTRACGRSTSPRLPWPPPAIGKAVAGSASRR